MDFEFIDPCLLKGVIGCQITQLALDTLIALNRGIIWLEIGGIPGQQIAALPSLRILQHRQHAGQIILNVMGVADPFYSRIELHCGQRCHCQ